VVKILLTHNFSYDFFYLIVYYDSYYFHLSRDTRQMLMLDLIYLIFNF